MLNVEVNTSINQLEQVALLLLGNPYLLKTFLAELFQCWKLSKEVILQLQVRARVVTRAKCA